MYLKKIIRNIFSVYNENYLKIVCIFGLKIKIFSPKRYTKFKNKFLDLYIKKNKLNIKKIETLLGRVENLEKKGFRLQNSKEDIILSNKRIKIKTDSYAWIAQEIFYDELYKIPSNLINKNKKYCILDIGANRCYTALYFADKKWVNKIYSFELVPQTYELALENITLNKKSIRDKINLFNYGLGAETKYTEALYLPDRDGISTCYENWLNNYAPKAKNKAKLVNCKIIKASEALGQIIEENNIDNIIFKIDVEGAEYEILEDLAKNLPNIFNKIKILIGDTHCGFEQFLRIISPFNFKIVEACPKSNGTCSFIIVNKEV